VARKKKEKSDLMLRVEAFTEKYEAARSAMLKEAGEAAKDFFSAIFEQFPDVVSFGWTQYTPYFNDGETCEFSVNSYAESIYINGINGDEQESNEYDEDSDLNEDEDSEESDEIDPAVANEAREIIAEILEAINSDVLLDMYGDHATVTIKRSGKAVINEYEHE